jgi:hypothetical protein
MASTGRVASTEDDRFSPPSVGAATTLTAAAWRAVHVLAAAYVLVVLALGLRIGNINTGDTNLLAGGSAAALECLGQGVLTSCGIASNPEISAVGPYPLLQYLPAFVGSGFGLSADHVVVLLAVLSLVAFAVCLVLPVVAFDAWRRPEARGRAAVAVLALLISSAPYQATAGFGEMLAATSFVAAVTVARRGWLPWLAPSVLLACLSKETMAPVVVVLCLAAASRGRLLPRPDVLWRVATGAVTALALSAAFNVFRFGTPRNASYLQPQFRTVPNSLLNFAAGEWLSPVAGVLFHWPVATAVLERARIGGSSRSIALPI